MYTIYVEYMLKCILLYYLLFKQQNVISQCNMFYV